MKEKIAVEEEKMSKLQEKLSAIKEQLDKNDSSRPDANSELGIAKAKFNAAKSESRRVQQVRCEWWRGGARCGGSALAGGIGLCERPLAALSHAAPCSCAGEAEHLRPDQRGRRAAPAAAGSRHAPPYRAAGARGGGTGIGVRAKGG